MKTILYATLVFLAIAGCSTQNTREITYMGDPTHKDIYQCHDACRVEFSHIDTAGDGREYAVHICPACGYGYTDYPE